jgi:hypothetical protein
MIIVSVWVGVWVSVRYEVRKVKVFSTLKNTWKNS